jgi:hypothetical protein
MREEDGFFAPARTEIPLTSLHRLDMRLPASDRPVVVFDRNVQVSEEHEAMKLGAKVACVTGNKNQPRFRPTASALPQLRTWEALPTNVAC